MRPLALPLQRPPHGVGRGGLGGGGAAAMAQLGERRAPDVKVPSSILSFGIFTPAPLRGVSLGFRFISRQRISKVGSDVLFRAKVQNAAPFRRPHPGPPYGHGPNPHRGIRVRANGIFPPEAMTGHQNWSPEVCFWHPSWPPELATRGVFWPPSWSPQRCFGPRNGHRNGASAPSVVTSTVFRHPRRLPERWCDVRVGVGRAS